MTNSPQFDFVFARRRAFARAKARAIFQEMDDSYGFQREAILAARLDEALSEYERGLEKIAEYSYQRLLDYEALRMNPMFIQVPATERKNDEPKTNV